MSDKAPFGTVTTCSSCGGRILAAADVCPKCGVRQHGFAPIGSAPLTYAPPTPSQPISLTAVGASEKRIVPTLIFCLLFGVFGAHRFYVGRPISAVVQLLTLGGLGIWVLVDLILLLTESFKDGDARPLKEWL